MGCESNHRARAILTTCNQRVSLPPSPRPPSPSVVYMPPRSHFALVLVPEVRQDIVDVPFQYKLACVGIALPKRSGRVALLQAAMHPESDTNRRVMVWGESHGDNTA